jgi:hypothetical protein
MNRAVPVRSQPRLAEDPFATAFHSEEVEESLLVRDADRARPPGAPRLQRVARPPRSLPTSTERASGTADAAPQVEQEREETGVRALSAPVLEQERVPPPEASRAPESSEPHARGTVAETRGSIAPTVISDEPAARVRLIAAGTSRTTNRAPHTAASHRPILPVTGTHGERAEPTEVHVTIGRIEVTALPTARPAAAPKRTNTSSPASTLADFLRGKESRRR